MLFYFTRNFISHAKEKEWGPILVWSVMTLAVFVVVSIEANLLWWLWFLPIVPIATALLFDVFLIVVIGGGYIPLIIIYGAISLFEKIFERK